MLENGDTALSIVSPLKQLFEQYGKRFSQITIMDFGNSKTVAETLTNELRLNCQFMNRPEALKAVLDKWERTGYIPKGCNNAAYVGRHEFFHLVSQDEINTSHSKIRLEIDRALKKEHCAIISKNASSYGCESFRFYHEFTADILSASNLTKEQNKLKTKIIKVLRGE